MHYLSRNIHACSQIFIVVTFLLCQNILSAKNSYTNIDVSGKVVTQDETILAPLPYATIQLLLKSDSSFVSGTSTNDQGVFKFSSVKGQEYLLLITSVGYQKIYINLNCTLEHKQYDLGEIHLAENTIQLAEASVTATKREMIVKNDTVEYDATAYRMRENAVAEDLLKRLPGISIDEEGRIFVNGKEVQKIMIDEQDFFRSDPNLSLKNIPTHIIDSCFALPLIH